MKSRKPKSSDQHNAEIAFQHFRKMVEDNPHIEASIWASACWSLLVDCYVRSKVPYGSFCTELENVKDFYKDHWNREDDS